MTSGRGRQTRPTIRDLEVLGKRYGLPGLVLLSMGRDGEYQYASWGKDRVWCDGMKRLGDLFYESFVVYLERLGWLVDLDGKPEVVARRLAAEFTVELARRPLVFRPGEARMVELGRDAEWLRQQAVEIEELLEGPDDEH